MQPVVTSVRRLAARLRLLHESRALQARKQDARRGREMQRANDNKSYNENSVAVAARSAESHDCDRANYARGTDDQPGPERTGGAHRGGVHLSDLSDADADAIIAQAAHVRKPGDVAIVSVHWGANWGYEVSADERRFAHRLIDGGIDIVHGHSSHHPKAIEVYHRKPIFYGCGDFLNDYEGIQGYEGYRDDLALMYFVDIEPASGKLAALEIVPLRIKQFRLNRADGQDVDWIRKRLGRESRRFATSIAAPTAGRLALSWPGKRALDQPAP